MNKYSSAICTVTAVAYVFKYTSAVRVLKENININASKVVRKPSPTVRRGHSVSGLVRLSLIRFSVP